MQATYRRNLEHHGVQIEFDGIPSEETRQKMKSAGFRWSRYQKIWYAKGWNNQAETVAKEIAEYGGEIGHVLTIAEKVDKQLERAEYRVDRYDERAEKAQIEGTSLLEQAHKMGDIIPFGQPIHVGHHSEKTDRNYRHKVFKKFEKGVETLEKAKYYEHRAKVAAEAEERLFNPGTVLRRIEKLQAEWRKCYRELDTQHLRIQQGYESSLSRKSLDYAESEMDRLDSEITYWKQSLEENGAKVWTPEDFVKGDHIQTRFGSAEVLRVNKKSLKVKFLEYEDDAWQQKADFSKIPYSELGQNCKHL